jgi:hypothetical protein
VGGILARNVPQSSGYSTDRGTLTDSLNVHASQQRLGAFFFFFLTPGFFRHGGRRRKGRNGPG